MENIVILSIEEYQRLLAIENQFEIMLEEEEEMLEAMYQDELRYQAKLHNHVLKQN